MELYCVSIDGADFSGMSLLTAERRERASRYMKDEDKARSLAAGLLIRYALGEERAARLTVGPKGKPGLDGGPCFNLSHSGRYVLLGVSGQPIGVDVERVRPWQDRVARRCFTAAELEWLYAQEEQTAFYKLWTAKESVMKATGLGFSLPPASFEVLPVADGPHVVEGATWFLRWLTLEAHEVCVACGADEHAELICLDWAALLGEPGRSY